LAARGATVDVIPYGQGGEAFLARLGQALERPADLVALSHLSCETGAFVDAGALADLCHERGALLLLDGAQTPGQIPLALNEWAVDLYAFNGHKWMLAPVGSAALYIRPDLRDRVAMTFTGDGPGYRSGYPDRVDVLRPDDGRRFEYGTRNWAAWAAWTDVLTFWAELPADAAYRRQRELASTLRRRLHNLEGVTVWSPELPVGGIVTFSVAGLNAEGLYDALYARDIIGRPVNKGPISGVRLCTAFFNNLDDVARAVEAVAAIVGAAATSRS
jgi:selenocysteine lyase/cysteine desulfurase